VISQSTPGSCPSILEEEEQILERQILEENNTSSTATMECVEENAAENKLTETTNKQAVPTSGKKKRRGRPKKKEDKEKDINMCQNSDMHRKKRGRPKKNKNTDSKTSNRSITTDGKPATNGKHPQVRESQRKREKKCRDKAEEVMIPKPEKKKPLQEKKIYTMVSKKETPLQPVKKSSGKAEEEIISNSDKKKRSIHEKKVGPRMIKTEIPCMAAKKRSDITEKKKNLRCDNKRPRVITETTKANSHKKTVRNRKKSELVRKRVGIHGQNNEKKRNREYRTMSKNVVKILQMSEECLQTCSKTCVNLSNHNDLLNQLSVKIAECDSLRTYISSLESQIHQKDIEIAQLGIQTNISTMPRNTLIIGDSVLRKHSRTHVKDHSIVCMPGACISGITRKLEDLSTCNKAYDKIVLHVGINDCLKKDCDIDNLVEQYKELILQAKRLTTTVVISSVLPTSDNEIMNNISELNASLTVMANTYFCGFICNDDSFYNKQGRLLSCLYHDAIHPNENGLAELASNWGLSAFLVNKNEVPGPTRKDNAQQHRDYMNVNSTNQSWKRPNTVHSDQRPDKNPRVAESSIKQQYKHRHHKHSTTQKEYHRPRNNNGVQNKSVWCDFCGEDGHVHSVCRHGGPIQCHRCSSFGHKEKHCH